MPFFFQFFTKKSLLSCPYFVKKTSLLQKHTLFMSIIVQKHVHFLKTHNALISFFSNFSLKIPAFMSIFGPKRQLCRNHTTYLKKSQQDAFFVIFTKNQKNVHTSRNKLFSVKKNVNFLKNTVLTCNLCLIFHEKHPADMPYWVKKTSTLLRLYYIMGQRSKWKPFFSDFSRKNHCSHVHILSKKCPISKKTLALMP